MVALCALPRSAFVSSPVAGLGLAFVLDHIGSHFNPAFYADTVPAAMTRSVMWFHTWPALLGTLTFTQGFLTPLYGSEGPTWSLAYEAFFYLTYPIVFFWSTGGSLRCLFFFTLLGLIAALASRLGVHVGARARTLLRPRVRRRFARSDCILAGLGWRGVHRECSGRSDQTWNDNYPMRCNGKHFPLVALVTLRDSNLRRRGLQSGDSLGSGLVRCPGLICCDDA